jgi:hypothetical protein
MGCGLSRLLFDPNPRGYKPLPRNSRRRHERRRRKRREREERRARRQARARRREARERRLASKQKVEALKTIRRQDWDTYRANRVMGPDGAWYF